MLLFKKKSLHGYQHWLVPDIFESSFSQLARMSESVRGFNERRDGEFYTATYCSDLTFLQTRVKFRTSDSLVIIIYVACFVTGTIHSASS